MLPIEAEGFRLGRSRQEIVHRNVARFGNYVIDVTNDTVRPEVMCGPNRSYWHQVEGGRFLTYRR